MWCSKTIVHTLATCHIMQAATHKVYCPAHITTIHINSMLLTLLLLLLVLFFICSSKFILAIVCPLQFSLSLCFCFEISIPSYYLFIRTWSCCALNSDSKLVQRHRDFFSFLISLPFIQSLELTKTTSAIISIRSWLISCFFFSFSSWKWLHFRYKNSKQLLHYFRCGCPWSGTFRQQRSRVTGNKNRILSHFWDVHVCALMLSLSIIFPSACTHFKNVWWMWSAA